MLPALASFSVSADSYWTNSTGNNQFLDVNNWDTLSPPSLSAGDIYLLDSGGQFVNFDLNNTYPNFEYGDGSMYIGRGAGNDARLQLTHTDTGTGYPNYAYLGGNAVIGSEGASGALEYRHGDASSGASSNIDFMSLTIGSGLNSQGSVSLFGTGKAVTEQYMSYYAVQADRLQVGVDGGKGSLSVDGSNMSIDKGAWANPTDFAFSLGNGTNSQGSMNVLSGGKVVISPSMGGYLHWTFSRYRLESGERRADYLWFNDQRRGDKSKPRLLWAGAERWAGCRQYRQRAGE